MISVHTGSSFPWKSSENKTDVEELEKALYRIFTSPDGLVVWEHLQRTILHTAVSGSEGENTLQFMNGKRSLALHLKNLAIRGKKS